MQLRRVLAAASIGVFAAAAGLFAAPVNAAANPTVDAYFEECGGDGGYIAISISGTADNVIFELGGIGFNQPAGQYSLGPWADGVYPVLFKTTFNGAPFFTDSVTIDCEPGVEVGAVCDAPTEGIGIVLTDDSSSTYSVAIDGTLVAEGIGDTGGVEVVYGPYADGEHLVEVYWAGYEEDDPFSSHTITKDCAGVGSGGSIPDTGSSSLTLSMIAGLLVCTGAAALLVRRTRAA